MNFEDYLPEGSKNSLLQERIQQLAAEGLANEIALREAKSVGNEENVEVFEANITTIKAAIKSAEEQLV